MGDKLFRPSTIQEKALIALHRHPERTLRQLNIRKATFESLVARGLIRRRRVEGDVWVFAPYCCADLTTAGSFLAGQLARGKTYHPSKEKDHQPTTKGESL